MPSDPDKATVRPSGLSMIMFGLDKTADAAGISRPVAMSLSHAPLLVPRSDANASVEPSPDSEGHALAVAVSVSG